MCNIHNLKEDILGKINAPEITGDWYELKKATTGYDVQKALDEHDNVYIPLLENPIVVDEPIRMSSNKHLKVHKSQVIMQSRDSYMCLLRNENLTNGAFSFPSKENRDKNISVEGGTWHIKTKCRCFTDKEKSVRGSLGAIIFSGVEQLRFTDMTVYDSEICGPAGTDDSSYAIQISNCKNFIVDHIELEGNNRDGVHINGPVEYGHVYHIRGDKMGDDMVALNAWDWYNSAVSFGPIENLVIEDIVGSGNELRLLPGQKLYDGQEPVDCDIRNIVLENLTGLYTVKLYAQPNIDNAIFGINDVSGTVGTIENILFKNITFKQLSAAGFHGLPVKSAFEVCADINNLYFEDISIGNSVSECMDLDLRFMNVGPLSAVWKNGSENPDDWGEVFDPDAICTADEIYMENITFAGEHVTDLDILTREVKMSINPDYPNTTPKGGTGYGTIKKVYAK